MKLAIVSIEDRRFPDHKGVDWQGTLRAFLTNTTTGEVQQGASTLDQQYVKNYQLLVVAKTDAERRAAIETTPARKIREIRMALTLDKELTKDEILTGTSTRTVRQRILRHPGRGPDPTSASMPQI